MNRRSFLHQTSLAAGTFLLPRTAWVATPKVKPSSSLRFGLVADVHHGMLPDTQQRLEVFLEQAQQEAVDLLIQLGDFCHPEEKSKPFLERWNSWEKPRYHVLGNHDMDLGSKAAIMDLWEMPAPFYAFVEKGIRFLVLDANFLYQEGKYIAYDTANFYVDDALRTFVHPEQIEWLAGELAASQEPVIVLSHQSLWHYQFGVKNRLAIQHVLEAHADKVICCFNGHNHIDYHHQQNGIHYLDINSMSYQWLGEAHQYPRYPEAMLAEYKWLNHLAPYQDPLFAMGTIEPSGRVEVRGVRSQWMPPSPADMGVPEPPLGNRYSPRISDRVIEGRN
ncbi:MAG: metallophosphoesterase [Bacteroidota bacterium]